MNVKISEGRETQQLLMVVRPGDIRAVERMGHIFTGLKHDLTRRVGLHYPLLRTTGRDSKSGHGRKSGVTYPIICTG
jgi:hypothetical protein